MSSKETSSLIETFPDPGDMHYMGSMDPQVLGRVVVRQHDFGVGRRIVNGAASAAAEASRDVHHESIYRDPSLDLTVAERAKVNSWAKAHNDEVVKGYLEYGETTIEDGLDSARESIRDIDLNVYGEYFDTIFDSIAPLILRHKVDAWRLNNPDKGAGAWLYLLGKESEDITDNDFMLNFLQWHNHRIESLQQDPEFIQSIETSKTEYLRNLKKAERRSYIAKGAYKQASRRLNSANIAHFVGDEFYAAQLNADAYAVAEEFTAYKPSGAVPGAIDALAGVVASAANHEFNHAVLGKLPNRWLDEAVTEHLALMLSGRDIQQVYSAGDRNAYEAERDLLCALIDTANRINEDEVLSILDFTHTYSLGHTEKRVASLQQLLTKLDMCFGFPVLAGLSGYLLVVENALEAQGVTTERERQQRALESARHVLAQQPEELRSYVQPNLSAAA